MQTEVSIQSFIEQDDRTGSQDNLEPGTSLQANIYHPWFAGTNDRYDGAESREGPLLFLFLFGGKFEAFVEQQVKAASPQCLSGKM
jgi:hypothetical protein